MNSLMNALTSFFREDWQFSNYNLTKTLNGFFYFLRRIPGIKKLISERIYSAYEIKSALGVLLTVLDVLFSFIKKILVLIVAVGVHILLTTFLQRTPLEEVFSQVNRPMLQQGAFVWFLLVVMIWSFYNQFAVTVTKKMINFYTEFALSRNQFILGQKFIEILKNAFFYFVVGIPYGLIVGKITLALFLPLAYLAGNFLLFVFCRWLYMRNYSLVKRRWIGGVATVLFLLIIGGLYSLKLIAPLTNIFTSGFLLPVWLILAVLGFRSMWHYPKQNEFIDKTIVQSVAFYEQLSDNTQKNDQYIGQGLKMQKQLQVNHDEKVDKLKGSEYLNALLFSRYRKVFNKKIRYLMIGFLVVSAGLVALRLANVSTHFDEAGTIRLLPLLFFLMYFISFGKQIVQMLFVNCDSSMLYYPFYREGGTILKGFTYRLRQTFMYNGLIILGILLLFVLLQGLNNFYLSWQFFGILLLLLVALSSLFSFHELFIYYLLQPFTADMTVKSPAYKVMNLVFYYFAYMNAQVRFSGSLYVIGISAISILYVAIGLVIIYRVAPRTFKVKE